MRCCGLPFFVVLALGLSASLTASAQDSPPRLPAVIDLRTAVSLALERSPSIEAMTARVGLTAARSRQAGLRPNPELRVEMEDFAGSGAFAGTDEAQTTIGVGQVLELGGKRRARLDVAEAAESVVSIDQRRVRRDLIAATSRAFYEVLRAQSERALADETVRIDEQIVSVVAGRVRAGSSSRVELTKAEVALARARMSRSQSERSLLSARRRLAATWGDSDAHFEEAMSSAESVAPPPTLASLLAGIEKTLELERSAAEIRRREAGVAVEERQRIPDVEVGLGYRRLAGPDDDAMVADLRLPLPIFDRNQGSVLEAKQRVAGAEAERRALVVDLAASLRESHDSLSMAHEEIRALDDAILPAATTAFDAIREGYREGRFSYLDLLDAERTLNDARKRRIDATTAYQVSLVEIDRLVGEEQ
jgi:cobalt-zinc-cadmium efflux system outer membrane protein